MKMQPLQGGWNLGGIVNTSDSIKNPFGIIMNIF